MEWDEYKRLCDSPPVFSRWMLTQSIELLAPAEPRLAAAIARAFERPPVEKPDDHRGGAPTDMFVVALTERDARAIVRAVGAAIDAGRTTAATRARGLGGFREAWREYAAYVERTDNDTTEGNMSDATTVVRSLIAAFNASDLPKVMTHFAADAVYHNIPVEPVTGIDAIRGVIEGFMGMATQVDWQLLNIAQSGEHVVMTERVDRFLINGKWIGLPVMGTFEVGAGKISAWRDYFDMNQFQSQLAG